MGQRAGKFCDPLLENAELSPYIMADRLWQIPDVL